MRCYASNAIVPVESGCKMTRSFCKDGLWKRGPAAKHDAQLVVEVVAEV